jgi:membrane protease YdiL (CAAX protease family)
MISFLKDVVENYLTLYSLLFLIYAVGFALISSLFNHKNLLKKYKDDLKAYIRYFAYFSMFLLLIPVIGVFLYSPYPVEILKNLGFQPGNFKLGLVLMLISIPILLVAAYISTNDPDLKKYYPFSKNACRSLKTFIVYEISYLLMYYIAWEFTFRGFFLFSIAEMMGHSKSGILVAILIQAIISTVFHLGHPNLEILSTLFGSIIFGIVAYATQSILYTIFIHAFLGILNDTFLYIRYHRKKETNYS